MKARALLLLISLSVFALQGCVIAVGGDDWKEWDEDSDNNWRKQERANKKSIGELQLGDTASAVSHKMGEPDFTEAFSNNGEAYKIYYYRTQQVRSDGRTTKDETTPLVFTNDTLSGWGESALEQVKPGGK